jgi:hypothetical protein
VTSKDRVVVVMTPEFIRDLQDSKHQNLARQALSHVFDQNGEFKADREDHPYDGMKDGWIRWVQMGGVGLRVIYIRKGEKVYLYRVVGKSDENGLTAPTVLTTQSVIESLPESITKTFGESEGAIADRLLKNTQPTYLREAIRRMFHVRHKEVLLVSPSLSQPLFRVQGEIGRFLDRAIEEGTRAMIVTLPPKHEDIEFFDELAHRNIEIYFSQNLNSRLFLFRVDTHRAGKFDEAVPPTAMLGSAELTHHGLDVGGVGRNEELCFRFPESHFSAFYAYADKLIRAAIDLQGHKQNLAR